MAEISNIPGNFYITLGGQERRLKCTFGAVEMLEETLLKRSITEVLIDATNGKIFMSDVAKVIYAGLVAANDTRLTRQQVGQAMYDDGTQDAVRVYVEFLTYAVNGGKEQKPSVGEDASQEI